jgi:1,2-diacylglycerol 3-alpha-glucosyltransferase
VVWNIPRTGRWARLLGGLARRNGYFIEQWSTFLPIAFQIRRFRPRVIFYSDSNLGFLLYRFRRQIGIDYRLLFSNGGPCHPPFSRHDFVQQVAPAYYEEALAAGEPRDKHFSVPYGIHVPKEPPCFDPELRSRLRRDLRLPLDRLLVLSVGWIAKQHKRMHYLIEEVARLPKPRPFLQVVGAMDSASAEVVALGRQLLGFDGFAARSVSPDQVSAYYRAADVFALASLQEGFGRVYLEALMHGLPVIAHRHPVMEYVLGQEGTLADLDRPGAMTAALSAAIREGNEDRSRRQRWESVRERFSWQKLAGEYVNMFRAVSCRKIPECR